MSHWITPWIVLVIALLVGVSGINTVPPNAHEVYVLRTAQAMHERSDWIVPRYEGKLRLEKPPLNYWVTGAAAWVTGESDHVQPWHGRVASVLGGLLLVGCTLLIGRRLFDRGGANLGGLITATSMGFVTYTHSARPEMLYAGCCAMVMLGLVMGYSPSSRPRPRKAMAGLGWMLMACAGFALATLSKGPHVPAMIVGGFAIWAMLNSTNRMRTALRGAMWLIIGAAIVTAAAGWWWWLMQHRLGEAELANSALGGEGFALDWSHVLSVDYLGHMVRLTATWAMLIPAGIALLMHMKGRGARSSHLIGWWLAVALVAFWAAAHRRDYYLLPYIGVMGLLLGAGTWRFLRIWHRQRWLRIGGALYAAGLATVIIVGSASGAFWSNQRFETQAFARQVTAGTPSDVPLVGLGTEADVVGYVANRNVPYCGDVAALRELAKRAGAGQLSVITPQRYLPDLADWSPVQQAQVVDEDSGKAMVWVRVTVP